MTTMTLQEAKKAWPKSMKERRALFWPIWIKALRSGDYKQGGGCLKQGNKFCCLGVACDLGSYGSWTTGPARARYKSPNSHPTSWSPQYPERELMGLEGPLVSTVVKMNDDQGKSFNQIADYLQSILDNEAQQ